MATYIFVSQVESDMIVVSRVPYETTFKECYVKNGRIEIDELEDEDFERQVVIEFGLRPMHF